MPSLEDHFASKMSVIGEGAARQVLVVNHSIVQQVSMTRRSTVKDHFVWPVNAIRQGAAQSHQPQQQPRPRSIAILLPVQQVSMPSLEDHFVSTMSVIGEGAARQVLVVNLSIVQQVMMTRKSMVKDHFVWKVNAIRQGAARSKQPRSKQPQPQQLLHSLSQVHPKDSALHGVTPTTRLSIDQVLTCMHLGMETTGLSRMIILKCKVDTGMEFAMMVKHSFMQ